ncbi:hypothetical protein B296_00007398 [Ensete ventricosum]|uniref:Uncharacterized protein n=1 Tax=Ensete ventricosum TaxID=4639 RepID=A0A427AX50_ENSVE|nr:hypothetical protein B296_00007398 [Ensete ventricosum]
MSYEHGFTKNVTVINFVESRTRIIHFAQSRAPSRVSIGFSCTVSKIQKTGLSQPISPWDVVRAWFCKKHDGHKLCAKSRAKSGFD